MAGMITRCPKCATAFRISEAHLQSAKGMVRCGNCLNVFNAQDNIQADSKKADSTTVHKATTSAAARAMEHSKKAATSSDQLRTRVQPASTAPAPAKPAPAPDPASKAKKTSKDGGKIGASNIFDDSSQDEHVASEDDESWALEPLKDDSDLNIQLKKIVTPEPKPKKTQPKLASPPATKPLPPAPKPIKDMLAAIEFEPLEVAFEDKEIRFKKRLIWSSLCVAAALLLLIQVVWLEFYHLSKVEPYRSYYANICSVLGCRIPDLTDRTAISTSNLMVRTHPTVPNALMVDVILQNNAEFPQSFPGILLSFSDLQSKPVAARRFAPKEYLGGELAGSTHMPVKQPIHVAIEVHDPGVSALSYNVVLID